MSNEIEKKESGVSKADLWFATNSKFFPMEKVAFLKEKISKLDNDKFTLLQTIELKDPTTMLLVSIFIGGLGIDRFMLGDTGMGILKLLTAGCCGILWLVDIFSIQGKTRELNYNKVMMSL